jgi:hypothetical protein
MEADQGVRAGARTRARSAPTPALWLRLRASPCLPIP